LIEGCDQRESSQFTVGHGDWDRLVAMVANASGEAKALVAETGRKRPTTMASEIGASVSVLSE
jgi:hypothetical protein